ncbi:endonuclease III [Candidatus Woesebacteria bacterium]|nr:MAG: endonuclease III [Candidatus Woesebacteria bacterium]
MNYEQVFKIFRSKYQHVPLEVFVGDPYKILVSTLLSSRTKDETTLKAANRLFLKANTVTKLNLLTEHEIARLIYPVGFYKTKARHLKMLSQILIDKYNGSIPKTRNHLMTLPGVGRKTANLVLNRAFSIPAIAVDTHVHKIANLLGWVKTTTPEKTEIELLKILPQQFWSQTNKLFVSIGRQFTTRKKLTQFLVENKLRTP